MGHIGEPATGGAVVMGCKVLPMWRENGGMVDGARKTMVHGKKAVARVKELLRRAAQPTGASRWKKVLSFQARDGGGGISKAGDDSPSKLSFKWDVGSCSSASASSSAMYSPLSAVSAPAKVLSTSSQQHQLRAWSAPVPGVRDEQRTAQWITTDSDFVVLEL
ncbi:uncharacterized protein LOC102718557 isoform X2 [Oryza brachyantha]|uniref:Uncharacterized protein n=2 Tax=Oryza brachyantha TaxID=4533 RepID=J3MAH3_ORYBR|nr:uncharacterized protein LOC102718557 isoform X2 [Oryza brachyantha]XP_015694287.1 uncharacterized protein LOC102718557 isoform X2 [Oryza brachyantha]